MSSPNWIDMVTNDLRGEHVTFHDVTHLFVLVCGSGEGVM